MTPLLYGLLGTLIGGIITSAFNIWRLRRDELNARSDELCDAISAVGEIASEYWSIDFQGKPGEARVPEARILGAQALMDGLYADLRVRLDRDEAERINELMSELLDALTGGQFSVDARPPDPFRVQKSTQAASEVIVAIRRAHHNTMPFSRIARVMNENRHRTFDLPRSDRMK